MPITAEPTFYFIPPMVVEKVRAREHNQYFEETGLMDFVSKVYWSDYKGEQGDMVVFINRFERSTLKSYVRGQEILLDVKSIGRIFKLPIDGDLVDLDKTSYTPRTFKEKTSSNGSYRINHCQDSDIKAKLDFQVQSLHVHGNRGDLAGWQIRQVETTPRKFNWSQYLTTRLLELFEKAHEKGNNHTWLFGSYLQVIISEHISSLVVITTHPCEMKMCTQDELTSYKQSGSDGPNSLQGLVIPSCTLCTHLLGVVNKLEREKNLQATLLETLVTEVNILKHQYKDLPDDQYLRQTYKSDLETQEQLLTIGQEQEIEQEEGNSDSVPMEIELTLKKGGEVETREEIEQEEGNLDLVPVETELALKKGGEVETREEIEQEEGNLDSIPVKTELALKKGGEVETREEIEQEEGNSDSVPIQEMEKYNSHTQEKKNSHTQEEVKSQSLEQAQIKEDCKKTSDLLVTPVHIKTIGQQVIAQLMPKPNHDVELEMEEGQEEQISNRSLNFEHVETEEELKPNFTPKPTQHIMKDNSNVQLGKPTSLQQLKITAHILGLEAHRVLIVKNTKQPKRKHNNYWTETEEKALQEGVDRHGTSWHEIKKAYLEILANRNQVQLKDKWRNMEIAKQTKMIGLRGTKTLI